MLQIWAVNAVLEKIKMEQKVFSLQKLDNLLYLRHGK